MILAKSLRLKGMRRVLMRLESVCATTVKKAVALLQKPPSSYAEAAGASRPYILNRYMVNSQFLSSHYCDVVDGA